jgi:hypothetical protein
VNFLCLDGQCRLVYELPRKKKGEEYELLPDLLNVVRRPAQWDDLGTSVSVDNLISWCETYGLVLPAEVMPNGLEGVRLRTAQVACSYYAVYTAMWVALDNPPQGQWSHARILQHFAPGRWRQPSTPLDRTLTRAIRRLYNARVHAQYMGERLTSQDSNEGLRTTRQVMQLVAGTLGLSFGRSLP